MSQYWMPVKVIDGEDCVRNNADAFRALGKKALIVTGRNSARKNGSLEDVEQALKAAGVECVLFDEVMSNPTLECVCAGAALAREKGADFVIGVGGGSPMDAAKVIALMAAQNITADELLSKPLQAPALPMAMIPTTAGTGSEVTQYSVLTIAAAQNKRLFATPAFFPTLALLDAKYTMELPRHVTIHTAVDALSHSLEGTLTVRSNDLSDMFARKGMGMIVSVMRKLLDEKPLDYQDRKNLLFASMLGGIVIANVGTTLVHAMGFPLTYFKHVDHGPSCGLLLREMLKLFSGRFPDRVANTLDCMGMKNIEQFDQFVKELLGEPSVRLTPQEVQQYTKASINAPNVKNSLYVANEQEMAALYTASLG